VEDVATLNVKNLDDALYQRLKARAAQQHRSVAQEVTRILTESLAEPSALSLLELEGLGRGVWSGIDAATHVSAERDAWD
jgi:thymidylate synthase ThyX